MRPTPRGPHPTVRRSVRVSLGTLAAVCVLGAPEAAQAQQEPALSPGHRIRVVSVDRGQKPYEASVVALRSDTLVLRRGLPGGHEVVGLPLASIERLEVTAGTKSNAGKGALTGGIVGGALGLVIGLAAWGGSDGGDFLEFGPEAVPVSMAFLGGAGAILGTFIGALSHTDRWAPVPLESLRLAPVEGGVALGAAMRVTF